MCPGKDCWHHELRAECLRWLDVGCIHFSSQHHGDWGEVRDAMLAKWDYLGEPGQEFDLGCLRYYGQRIMKTERYTLRDAWEKAGANPRAPAPPTVPSSAWTRLVDYWVSGASKRKSDTMKAARAAVQNPNVNGRKGIAPIVAELVR